MGGRCVPGDARVGRPDGKLELSLEKVWRYGTRALVFEGADLIARLVAALPPPHFHRIDCAPHGSELIQVEMVASPSGSTTLVPSGGMASKSRLVMRRKSWL